MALLRSLQQTNSQRLRRFSIVGDEIEFCAGGGFEFGGAFCAGEIVANAKCVPFDFIDAGESLAGVWSFNTDDGHALWLGGGISRPCSFIRFSRDGCDILILVEFELNRFKEISGHGLAAQFSFDGQPSALKCFDIGRIVSGECSQRGQSSETDKEDIFHSMLLGCSDKTLLTA